MKNPVYEQIQARKVKARVRMLQHAQRIPDQLADGRRFRSLTVVDIYTRECLAIESKQVEGRRRGKGAEADQNHPWGSEDDVL